MEESRQFNQEQKLVILEGAKEVGIKEASRIAGHNIVDIQEYFSLYFAIPGGILRKQTLNCWCSTRMHGR